MNGKEEMLFQYLEGASKRFIIPVYQRNYNWQTEQCKQLYNDLIKLHKSGAMHHFFGSIVCSHNYNSGMQEFLVIDGQQRLTTVSLLLLAMYNLLNEGKLESKIPHLKDKILEQFLIDKYEEDTRLKLKPIKDDSKAFDNLLEAENDYIMASNITINYKYFYKRLQIKEISIGELYDAFCKLQIINIFLGPEDNPQLIFESLNSTGMDLSEGDKIRNYILMGLSPVKLQEQYYNKYWYKIEKHTDYDVSMFIRDYLSIKSQSTPAMKKIYIVFKEFMEERPFEDKEKLLEDLLAYARRYENLLRANTGNTDLDAYIDRLNKFEATVTRPFLMEVLRLSENNQQDEVSINSDDLIEIFQIVESYIFRRQLCDIPTNALNKVFVALNNEIVRYDGTTNLYLEKFKYVLLRKTASGLFPDDTMFSEALSTKQIYLMRSKNKKYLLERYENWGTKEVKDVWELINNGTYTIEHIMPQTLQNEWKEALGEDYESIHEEWVHRLANLTLTAYNSTYSNSTFNKKKNSCNGFSNSGIRMNQRLANYDKWTLDELTDRNEAMIQQGLKIWPIVDTDYKPIRKSLDIVSLADDYSLKGRKIAKYSYKGAERSVSSWVEMYLNVLLTLHAENPLILLQLAAEQIEKDLSLFVSDSPSDPSKYAKLDDGVYLWTNSNTETKIGLLRRFLNVYGVEEEELLFFLQGDVKSFEEFNNNVVPRDKIRFKFWDASLPILSEKTGRFTKVNPSVSNWQSTFFGKAGINISVIGNLDNLRVELYIGTKDPKLNDRIFEYIESRKDSIEKNANAKFVWTNEPQNRTAKIGIDNPMFGIENEEIWQDCIGFLVQGVNIMAKYYLPILDEFYEDRY